MTHIEFLPLASAFLTWGCFLFLFYFVWRDRLRVELFKSELFALRDSLFDFAADGHVAFDHPAYELLRRRMNGLIRSGHQLTITKLIALSKLYNNDDDYRYIVDDSTDELAEAFEDVEHEWTRKQLQDYHEKMIQEVVIHVVRGSLALVTLLTLMVAWNLAKSAVTGAARLSIRSIMALPKGIKVRTVDAGAAEAGC